MSAVSRLEQILQELRRELPRLRREYKIRSLGLFGSYVRQEERSDSDLDLLVEFEETPSLLTFLAIENALSDRLGIKVDLVMKDSLKPSIGKSILAEAIPV